MRGIVYSGLPVVNRGLKLSKAGLRDSQAVVVIKELARPAHMSASRIGRIHLKRSVRATKKHTLGGGVNDVDDEAAVTDVRVRAYTGKFLLSACRCK